MSNNDKDNLITINDDFTIKQQDHYYNDLHCINQISALSSLIFAHSDLIAEEKNLIKEALNSMGIIDVNPGISNSLDYISKSTMQLIEIHNCLNRTILELDKNLQNRK